jgi:para-nitrobenzyl esterase
VPVMIGQTHDERTQSMFARRDHVGRPVTKEQYVEEIHDEYGEHADAVLKQYPVSAYWSPTIALATVDGDRSSCQRLALFGYFSAHTPTYAYEFDEQDPPPFVSIWRLHTTFVKTGDPNNDFVPHWPRYSSDTQEVMSLKASGTRVKTDFADDHKCGFWASISD